MEPVESHHAGAAFRAAEFAARTSYGRLLAFLSARNGDIAGAEDALSAAFEAALNSWPQTGIPDKPDAWLLTAARHSLIDLARHRKRHIDSAIDPEEMMSNMEAHTPPDTEIPDERLGLLFACAHPAIEAHSRAPLMLQTVLGFEAGAIASAFLVAPAAMSQRLVRAKQKIRLAGIPFVIPGRDVLHERVDSVANAIYAAYANGWSDPAGTEPHLMNLAAEAIWLGRVLASLLPDQPETLGLLALMLYSDARRTARRGNGGEYIPLSAQDPALWHKESIDEAERLLVRAASFAMPGRFQLEAALQSAHVVRRHTGSADWHAIVMLYDALLNITGSPVVAINRAVALAETDGPAAGIAGLDAIANRPGIGQYQPYWAARADLLKRSGDTGQARIAYGHAIGLESDQAVRSFLQKQLAEIQ
ncbi:MAG TPA: DUF6596 domain-containing protein [Burkholderiaceae bacterium]